MVSASLAAPFLIRERNHDVRNERLKFDARAYVVVNVNYGLELPVYEEA
jgi:hypothetical protein